MITKFENFLNESESDDIKKRLLQRIENAFKQERDKHGIEHPVKRDIIPIKPTDPNKPKEPKLRSKPSIFGDSRLDDAFNALSQLYGKTAAESYINDIILEPDDTTESIIYWGMIKLGTK